MLRKDYGSQKKRAQDDIQVGVKETTWCVLGWKGLWNEIVMETKTTQPWNVNKAPHLARRGRARMNQPASTSSHGLADACMQFAWMKSSVDTCDLSFFLEIDVRLFVDCIACKGLYRTHRISYTLAPIAPSEPVPNNFPRRTQRVPPPQHPHHDHMQQQQQCRHTQPTKPHMSSSQCNLHLYI